MEIPGYDELHEIGRGGMGIVFSARTKAGRPVAIKLLNRPKDEAVLAQFDRERRLLELLGEAAGFVPLLDFGSTPRGPIIVMPFFSGGTLRDRLKLGPLPHAEVARIGVALATALGNAHEKGIVHRDVKPENVIFTEKGKPLFTDLGISKHFRKDVDGASQTVSITRDGVGRGSAGYMAPEQMMSAKHVGPAADVFALGTVLYECLTGEPAFAGENLPQLAYKASRGKFAGIRTLDPAIPLPLAAVVEQALARKPAGRFANGHAFAAALEAAIAGQRASVPGLHPVVVLAWGAALLSLLGLGVVLGVAPRHGPPVASSVAPVATSSAEEPLPEETRGVAATKLTRLTRVLGAYRPGHRDQVTSVAFSPDEKRALSTSADGTVRILDLAGKKELVAHPRAGARLTLLSVQGTLALARNDDHTLAVYDLAKEAVVRTLEVTSESGPAVLSPDGLHALVTVVDKLVFLDLETDKKTAGVPARRAAAAVFAPDGRRALSASGENGALVLWDLASGDEIQRFKGKHEAVVGAFAAGGERIVAGLADGTLEVFEVASGRSLLSLGHAKGRATAVAGSPDGRRILAGDSEGTIRLLDAVDGTLLRTLEGHRGSVLTLAFSATGSRALSGGFDRSVKLWDLEQGRELASFPGCPGEVRALALAGERLIAAASDGSLTTFGALTGKTVSAVAGRAAFLPGERPILSRDGKLALVLDAERTPLLVDATTGVEERSLGPRAEPGWPYAAAFSPGADRLLLSGARGAGVAVLDPSTGESTGSLPEPRPPWWLVFSPDGARALAGGAGPVVRLWDVATGAVLKKIDGNAWFTVGAAFAPEGARALVGSRDGSLVLLDLVGDAKAVPFVGHTQAPHLIAFTGDGRRAITTGLDRTIRIWDVAKAEELDRIDLALAGDRAGALAVEADGKAFWVGTVRGVILRFEMNISDRDARDRGAR